MKDNRKALETKNKQLASELKQKLFELSLLYEISNAISYSLDYNELIRLIMDSLHKVIDYDICTSLMLSEEGKSVLTIKATRPIKSDLIEKIKIDLIKKVSSLSKRSISLEDLTVNLRNPRYIKKDTGAQAIGSSFDVPLVSRDRLAGMLSISSIGDIAYSDDEIKLLYTIANQASSAIEKLQAVITAEKSKMNVMVENMAEGVIMTDEKDKLIVVNPSARVLLGLGNKHAEENKIFKFCKDQELIKPLKEAQKAKDKVVVKEVSFDEPYARIIRSQMTLVKDKEERSIGVMTILRDVTKEREIEKMKSDFVSTVSHELRTPLTAIKGATENLIDGITGELSEIQKSCLGVTKKNIDRLSRLINDLLDVSRIESGRLQIKKEEINIKELIMDSISLLNKQAEDRQITIDNDIVELPLIYADSDRIIQVLINLIGNAIKFTPEGGKIKVEAQKLENEIKVSVIDTGAGLNEQDLKKVFDKFYQVEKLAQPKVKGTGLGLPISKGVIEKHGGKIWAESKINGGCRFIFTLPVSKV